MLSRVANSIYWMSRYFERAENIARFIDVNLHLILDSPVELDEQWEPLIKITGDIEHFEERYGDDATKDNVIHFLTFDRENPNSIISALTNARENARSVREIISSEMWEQINKSYFNLLGAEGESGRLDSPHDFYTNIKMQSHLFIGITDTTMSHGEGWHFARLGRLIERADKTSRILDVKYFILLPRVEDVGSPIDNIEWAALLKSASAFEMYRKKYRKIDPRKVAEFLMLDSFFPRSIHYCLMKAEESLHKITGTEPGTYRNEAERKLGRLCSELDYANIDEIISGGLHEYLDNFQTKLNLVGDAIFDTFFALTPIVEGQHNEFNGTLKGQE
ncbi:MAG: alpha-E domain-containing protein [Deltaproteobacteria bacterium]